METNFKDHSLSKWRLTQVSLSLSLYELSPEEETPSLLEAPSEGE